MADAAKNQLSPEAKAKLAKAKLAKANVNNAGDDKPAVPKPLSRQGSRTDLKLNRSIALPKDGNLDAALNKEPRWYKDDTEEDKLLQPGEQKADVFALAPGVFRSVTELKKYLPTSLKGYKIDQVDSLKTNPATNKPAQERSLRNLGNEIREASKEPCILIIPAHKEVTKDLARDMTINRIHSHRDLDKPLTQELKNKIEQDKAVMLHRAKQAFGENTPQYKAVDRNFTNWRAQEKELKDSADLKAHVRFQYVQLTNDDDTALCLAMGGMMQERKKRVRGTH